MYDYFFTFRSVTAAMEAKELLEKSGIKTVLSRTPKSLKQQGCGYSLRLRAESPKPAIGILEREGASYQRLYRRDEAEQWREVAL